MGCKVVPTDSLWVTVADGTRMCSKAKCDDFCWVVHGQKFYTSVRLLPIGGCDVVLGVEWLKSISPFEMDLNKLKMSFVMAGRKVTLRGITETGELKYISASGISSCAKKLECGFIGQLFYVTATPVEEEEVMAPELQRVLDQFAPVFDDIKGLPPIRRHDHRIPLKNGSDPPNVRPYRYPHIQKEEIEKQVSEMLSSGIIRPNTSPFASPVLLVKKKDNCWRLCVDYMELNALTIKDKLPILIIDELLDELHDS